MMSRGVRCSIASGWSPWKMEGSCPSAQQPCHPPRMVSDTCSALPSIPPCSALPAPPYPALPCLVLPRPALPCSAPLVPPCCAYPASPRFALLAQSCSVPPCGRAVPSLFHFIQLLGTPVVAQVLTCMHCRCGSAAFSPSPPHPRSG